MPKTAGNKNSIFWLGVFIIFAVLTYVLRSILLPFAVGCIVGYLFDPLVDRLEKMKVGRTTASCLVLLLIFLIVVPAFLAIGYLVAEQIRHFLSVVPQYTASIGHKLSPILTSLQENYPSFSKEGLMEYLQNNFAQGGKIVGKILQKIITGSFAVVNIVSLLMITPIVAFYMLRDWNSFVRHADELLPKAYKKDIREQARAIDKIISSFIRGQISVCLILGCFYAVGLSIIGLDLGLLVGFIAGVISFIPYVGSITGFVLSLLIAFAQFNTITPIVAVVSLFIIGQILEGNFLTPKLVGDSVGLHPVWVMFALLAGGVLLGFLGLLIAVPLAAVIGVLLRYFIAKYKKSSVYLQ